MDRQQKDKWDAIYAGRSVADVRPAEVLLWYAHLLPTTGTALDLACGLGGNSIFLAHHGLQVCSWDISAQAVNTLRVAAAQQQLAITAEERDVISAPPSAEQVDVLVVSYFLAREICPALSAALKPGGILFYQTFCQDKVTPSGPKNPQYLLAENELLQLFSGLTVRAYREEGGLGDRQQGWRNQALLVAQKN